MAVCPKCGYKLKLTDWKPNCPKCGINLNYYGLEVYDHCEMEELVFEQADGYGILGNVSLDIASVLNCR